MTKSVEKGAVPSKERNLNPPRIKVTEPSHSASSISPIDRVVLETTAEIVQQSTPTQDELEDKETEVLSGRQFFFCPLILQNWKIFDDLIFQPFRKLAVQILSRINRHRRRRRTQQTKGKV